MRLGYERSELEIGCLEMGASEVSIDCNSGTEKGNSGGGKGITFVILFCCFYFVDY